MDTNPNSKAAYVRPSLQRLGSVGSLTAGGSGDLMEGAAMTAMMRNPFS
jgi:hypothetical protein